LDSDGLDDRCEQQLAELYAPVVLHAVDEPNFPTEVPEFLAASELRYYDGCGEIELGSGHSVSSGAAIQVATGCSPPANLVDSFDPTRRRGFYLANVVIDRRRGSVDPGHWHTYFHAYPNRFGGVTLQYWRFYAFNTGKRVLAWEVGSHGGDWEATIVVLVPAAGANWIEAKHLLLLQHSGIERLPWRYGQHVIVRSEPGGHASYVATASDVATHIWHDSRTGGEVRAPMGGQVPSRRAGQLRNLGEKSQPMNGMEFLRYAGLWGAPLGFLATGYWGPAFNDTDRRDNFVTAWCVDMADSLSGRGYDGGGAQFEECSPYPIRSK
jgi:hypothetical protein